LLPLAKNLDFSTEIFNPTYGTLRDFGIGAGVKSQPKRFEISNIEQGISNSRSGPGTLKFDIP
jgi:hypothetical protein